jgi:hypothetical protein
MTRTLLRLLALCAGLLAGTLAWGQTVPADAPDPAPVANQFAIRTDCTGAQVNWLTGQLEAVGIGYIRDRSKLAGRQARMTAMTTMRVEARRALLGIRVDAATTLADLAKDAQSQRILDSILNNLVTLNERTGGGKVTIIGVLPLYGEQGITYFCSKGLTAAKPVELKGAELTLIPEIPRGYTPQKFESPFTGVIIDAGSMLITPCLFPRVLRFDGKELWGPTLPTPISPVAIINGPACYAPNLQAALAGNMAGARPMILQAIGVGKSYYPAVNLDDVWLLLTEQKYNSILNNLPVVFTLGQPAPVPTP